MKLYHQKFSTSEFKIELLTTYIIFLKNQHTYKYKLLSNNFNNLIDLHLIKHNKNHINNLVKYDDLNAKFQDLTNKYYILYDDYKKNNIKNLVNFNSLTNDFKKLTIQYNLLQQDYNKLSNNTSIYKKTKNNKSSEFKLSNLNILRFM